MENNIYIALASHCIGLDHKKPYKRHGRYFYRPYRNHFAAGKKYRESWDVMVDAGYAEAGEENIYGCRKYWLTREGIDWLGEKLGIRILYEEE